MLEDLNVRMCHITGTIQGVYDKKLKKSVIKSGIDKKGQHWQVFELEVSRKDRKTGEWTRGKNLKVTLFGETSPLNIGETIGLGNCFFEPNNYVDKNGFEHRDIGVVALASKLFTPKEW
jgi:hypothetical protein